MVAHAADADPRVDELLLRWEELHEQGQTLSAAELCSTCPELADELARRIALLRQLDPILDRTSTTAIERIRLEATGRSGRQSATARAEFLDLRYHAAGALGEVFLARNAELNRDVALKFLKPSRNRDAESVRRFLREAEVTSRLEHPGVVPIYALGTDEAGSPCYAMRFVRGATLQDAIDAFHAPRNSDRKASEQSLALRELLNRFVSICNTVGYAHSRGILHRDLKPRNVMLGKFDETLVVDWGLAKPFERGESAETAGEDMLMPGPSHAGNGPETPTVGVVGTVAYMSPEQAEARSDLVGPASDLFSLGAILYTILTGQVPYRGAAYAEILQRVKRCEFPRPREVKPEVPRALEAVCLKAMAAMPAQRYGTVLELAAEVKRWLGDESVTAYSEPISARMRRWAHRHQGLVTGGAAAAVVGIIALAAVVTVVSTANRNLLQARALAERERDQAAEVTNFLVSSFRKADPAQDGRNVTAAEILTRAVTDLERRSTMVPTARASLLSAVGLTYRGLGLISENLDVSGKALAIRRQAIGDQHPDTLSSMNDNAVAFCDASQFDRAIELHEQALNGRRAMLGADHPDTLTSMSNLAVACSGSGQFDRAIELHNQVLDLQNAKLGEHHRDTLTSIDYLASTFYSMKRFDRAIALHTRAFEARKSALGEDHPETLASMANLGAAYLGAGQLELAIPMCQRALLAQRVKLGENHPDTLTSLNNLAAAFESAGQRDRAIPLKEQVVAARKAKLGATHQYTLLSMHDLSMAYWAQSQFDRVIPLCEELLALRQSKLGEDHPDTLMSTSNLAMAYMAAGRFDRVIPLCEQMVNARRLKLGDDHPDTLDWMYKLAKVYEGAGNRDRAISLLEQVVKGRQARLGEDHPDTLLARKDLAWSYQEARRYHEAEPLCREIVAAVGRAKPRNDPLYCESLASLGRCLSLQQHHVEGVSVLGECLKIMEKTQPADWNTATYRSMLGEALSRQGSFAEAERLLLSGHQGLVERSAKIQPHHRDEALRRAVDRLVQLYESWGKPFEAEEKWRRQLRPVAPEPHGSRIEETRGAPVPAASPSGR